MFAAINAAPVPGDSLGETAEAKTARLTSTNESALRKLQDGHLDEASGEPPR